MARKYKHAKIGKKVEFKLNSLSSETRHSIIIIVLFACAAIFLLSLLDLAGAAGLFLKDVLTNFIGRDAFLIPIFLIIIAASQIRSIEARMTGYNYVGMLFFVLAFNALLNLVALNGKELTQEVLKNNGGYIGLFLSNPLQILLGFWGALVVLTALLFTSILLIFNTSLRAVLGVHTHLTGGFGKFLHMLSFKKKSVDESLADDSFNQDDVDARDEAEGAPIIESALESDEVDETNEPNVVSEKALTTRRQRKMEVPIELLQDKTQKASFGDINRNKELIEKTLAQFGIKVEMGEVSVGPTVTQFTLRPADGVKLAKILALNNDLALALAAHPIRIEAPIPGKSLVGIEVPNQVAAPVSLRSIIESKPFREKTSNLTVALGKDVSGKPWVVPLDRMPHMLVAGATGSGKSVCLNTMIVSLLYQNGPDDIKFIMVDPKRVELNVYEGIPHLLVPPITKIDETINALKWTTREMERRLDVLSAVRARDINSFNARSREKMPKIVVFIDELADLIKSPQGHEIEAGIIRIAQMARAVGIHLVLATQRPSVDVITGLIKANVPGRIAFAVASQTDSRTILDGSGAEKLLGRGDMLFSSAELSKPKRLQGCYVSDDEIRAVVEFLKKEEAPDYNFAITEKHKTGTVFDSTDDEDEPLLDEAIQSILSAKKASTSFLQRRLKIGYARAARIIDLLEERGVVGPGEGAKPREVLVGKEYFENDSYGSEDSSVETIIENYKAQEPPDENSAEESASETDGGEKNADEELDEVDFGTPDSLQSYGSDLPKSEDESDNEKN